MWKEHRSQGPTGARSGRLTCVDKSASGPQFSHLSNGHGGALHSGEGSVKGHRGSFIQSHVSAHPSSPRCSLSTCFLHLARCPSGPRFLRPGSQPGARPPGRSSHSGAAVSIVIISWPSVASGWLLMDVSEGLRWGTYLQNIRHLLGAPAPHVLRPSWNHHKWGLVNTGAHGGLFG